jgi:hypothetical protein
MLDVFLMWNAGQPTPSRSFEAPRVAPVAGWQIRLGHDLRYSDGKDVALRQVVTDSAIRSSTDLRLFGLASLLHFEALNRTVQLTTVDVWSSAPKSSSAGLGLSSEWTPHDRILRVDVAPVSKSQMRRVRTVTSGACLEPTGRHSRRRPKTHGQRREADSPRRLIASRRLTSRDSPPSRATLLQ